MGFGLKGGNATCSLGKGEIMEVGKHRNWERRRLQGKTGAEEGEIE